MNNNDIAIKVEGLSKCYQVYQQPTHRIKQAIYPRVQRFIGKVSNQYYREFWALRNVTFEVRKGETVGIIGRNGSGKSTLLQMICGTLEPTSGAVRTNGRVAALLELGAGFNPEFSGRENVYLNATVLGLSHKEIEDRFEQIAAFADIGEFIEQPVKHYSSGMYARLAFAVAINVDPSILIVDEALAVGDEPFQRKCFAKIEEIKRGGATILFVSHASSAIVALCDRAILLHEGEKLYIGSPKAAISWYQKLMNASAAQAIKISTDIQMLSSSNVEELESPISNTSAKNNNSLIESPNENQGSKESYDPTLISKSMVVYEQQGAEIFESWIETLEGRRVNHLLKGNRYRITYKVRFDMNAENVRFYSIIKTVQGVELGGGTFPSVKSPGANVEHGQVVQVFFEFDCNLRADTYFFNCGVANNSELLHRIIDASVFRVDSYMNDYANGIVDFGCASIAFNLSEESEMTAIN